MPKNIITPVFSFAFRDSLHFAKGCNLTIILLSIFLSSGCQATKVKDSGDLSYEAIRSTVSANFAPDGRLWRLVPTKTNVYVQASTDNGHSYGKAIKINPTVQKISAWPENPPAITISPSGRIHILYYADEQQKSTSFFSFSDDNGQTFSKPVLISDHASTAMHYMDKMLVDNHNKVYLFWHDTRHNHSEHKHHTGKGSLALYYSSTDNPASDTFNNEFISDSVCSCCRTATTLSPEGLPVILVRLVFAGEVRDHALIKMKPDGNWSKPERITYDDWQIDACPEHGPALAIDDQGRSHLAWFTLGQQRQGIFYAQSDDYGKTVSDPVALGNLDYLPSHPDVITLGNQVVITWKEFDGDQSNIMVKTSLDRGKTWLKEKTVLQSAAKSGHPALIHNGRNIFLSWTTQDEGHQLVKIDL